MGSTGCDDAAFQEVYRILQASLVQDTEAHVPVSRELLNKSNLTTLVIAENYRNDEGLPAFGGCSPGGDAWHFCHVECCVWALRDKLGQQFPSE